MQPFRTEPYSDFGTPDARAAYQNAIDTVMSKLGGHVPLVIGGKPVDTDERIVSIDPAQPEQVVGSTAQASAAEAQIAIDAAKIAYLDWSRRPAQERAELVHRIGDILAERKFEMSAWMTLEAGKNWAESEADVAEAIDFCRYYAHEALRLAEPVPVHSYPGETNESHLIPLPPATQWCSSRRRILPWSEPTSWTSLPRPASPTG